MYQQQPYYSQPQTQPSMMRQMQSVTPTVGMPLLKGRLVSSIDEARAAPIDFDGSVFYFPDLANQKIYTKQINMDGTATLNMYELKELPISSPTGVDNSNFVTREELEKILIQLRSDLQQAIQPQQNTNSKVIQF